MSIFESLFKIPLFEPEPGLMIWTVISFGLLFILLVKVGYRPILDIIKKREDTIRGSIDEAERTRTEAERLLEDYKKQLAEARKEAHAIIEQGKKLGESVKQEMVDKAQSEAQQMVDKAKSEIEREKSKALSELQAKVADLTVLTTGKVLKKALSKEDHLKLIEDSLAEVTTLEEN